jgi:hypothetical protein
MNIGVLPPEWESAVRYMPVDGMGQALPVQSAVFGDDAQLMVRFLLVPERDLSRTLQLGEEVFEYREYVRIQKPGDKTTIVCRRATDRDKMRFPNQYMAFKRGETTANVGLPVTEWDYHLSETQVYALRLMGVEYVHQIAGMSEIAQQTLGIDAREMVAMAKITTAKMDTKQANASIQNQLDEYKRELDEMKRKLAERDLGEAVQIERMLEVKQIEKEREAERAEKSLEMLIGASAEVDEAAAAVHALVKRKGRKNG